ncbi:MAG: hypothetical protein ACC628_18585 [Pirellulaceae bacterium]
MARFFLMVAVVLASSPLTAHASTTYIWLSDSAADAGFGEVPHLAVEPGQIDQTLFVWARPEAGKTLRAWSLNLRSTNKEVLEFTGIEVYNPTLSVGDGKMAYQRYDLVGDSAAQGFSNVDDLLVTYAPWEHHATTSDEEVYLFMGTALNMPTAEPRDVVAVGINPNLMEFGAQDDAAGDAWLLATITYDVVKPGGTDLYLQIGSNGILSQGESTRDHFVVFGDPSDPALNAGHRGVAPGKSVPADKKGPREVDSATADATVVSGATLQVSESVPEPSSVAIALLATLLLYGFGRMKRRRQ